MKSEWDILLLNSNAKKLGNGIKVCDFNYF